MIAADIREISFVDDFQDFYAEVIRLRSLATAGLEAPGGEQNACEAQAEAIRARLIGVMERWSLFAGRTAGELGFGLHRELQYVMAALADEVFLSLDWPGNEYWTSHLLETQLFNSHNAGEEFFKRLDRLLDQPERSYTDIYTVYLMALALGFRGKYRGADDGGRLDAYRGRLFRRIYRRQPELFGESGRLFPESYRHTLDEGVARKLPSPSRWFLGLAAAVVIWIGISGWLWKDLTADLMKNVDRVNNVTPARKAAVPQPQGDQ